MTEIRNLNFRRGGTFFRFIKYKYAAVQHVPCSANMIGL